MGAGGMADVDTPELKAYARRRDELSSEGGCVLWGSSVIVPLKGKR